MSLRASEVVFRLLLAFCVVSAALAQSYYSSSAVGTGSMDSSGYVGTSTGGGSYSGGSMGESSSGYGGSGVSSYAGSSGSSVGAGSSGTEVEFSASFGSSSGYSSSGSVGSSSGGYHKPAPRPSAFENVAGWAGGGDGGDKLAEIYSGADAFFCQCGCILQHFEVEGSFAQLKPNTRPQFAANVRAIPVRRQHVVDDWQTSLEHMPLQRVSKIVREDGKTEISEYAAVVVIESPPELTIPQRKTILDMLTEQAYSKAVMAVEMLHNKAAEKLIRGYEAKHKISTTMINREIFMQSDPKAAVFGKKKIQVWNKYCKLQCFSEVLIDPQKGRGRNHFELAIAKRGDDPFKEPKPFSDERINVDYLKPHPPDPSKGEVTFYEEMMRFINFKKTYFEPLFRMLAAIADTKAVRRELDRVRVQIYGRKVTRSRARGGRHDFDESIHYGHSSVTSSAGYASSALSQSGSGGSSSGYGSGDESGYETDYSDVGSSTYGSTSGLASSSGGSGGYSGSMTEMTTGASYGSGSSGYGSEGSSALQVGDRGYWLKLAKEKSCVAMAQSAIVGEKTTWAKLYHEHNILRNPAEIYEPGKVPRIESAEGGKEGAAAPAPAPAAPVAPAVQQPKVLPLFGAGGGAAVPPQDVPATPIPAEGDAEIRVLVQQPKPDSGNLNAAVVAEEIVKWIKKNKEAVTPVDWPISGSRNPSDHIMVTPLNPAWMNFATLVRDPTSGLVSTSSAYIGRSKTTRSEDSFPYEYLALGISEDELNQLKINLNLKFESWLVPVMDTMFGADLNFVTQKIGEASAGYKFGSNAQRGNVVVIGHEHAQAPKEAVPTKFLLDHTKDVKRAAPGGLAGGPGGGPPGGGGPGGPPGGGPGGPPGGGKKLNIMYPAQNKPYSPIGGHMPHAVQRIKAAAFLQKTIPAPVGEVPETNYVNQEHVAKFELEYRVQFFSACWAYVQNENETKKFFNENRIFMIAQPEKVFVHFNNDQAIRVHEFQGTEAPHVLLALSGDGLLRAVKNTNPIFQGRLNKNLSKVMNKVIITALRYNDSSAPDLFFNNSCKLPRQPNIKIQDHVSQPVFHAYYWDPAHDTRKQSIKLPQEFHDGVGSILSRCYGRVMPTSRLNTVSESGQVKNTFICQINDQEKRMRFVIAHRSGGVAVHSGGPAVVVPAGRPSSLRAGISRPPQSARPSSMPRSAPATVSRSAMHSGGMRGGRAMQSAGTMRSGGGMPSGMVGGPGIGTQVVSRDYTSSLISAGAGGSVRSGASMQSAGAGPQFPLSVAGMSGMQSAGPVPQGPQSVVVGSAGVGSSVMGGAATPGSLADFGSVGMSAASPVEGSFQDPAVGADAMSVRS